MNWAGWLAGSLLGGACALAGAAEPAAPGEAPPQVSNPALPGASSTTPAAVPPISPSELGARLREADSRLVVLDVRTPAEFAAGHVPGARNISHDQLSARLGELADAKHQDVVLYCRSGRRSQIAAQTLREGGFTRLLQLEGDFPGWQAGGHPVGRKDPVSPKD
jgi:phage shock protein E